MTRRLLVSSSQEVLLQAAWDWLSALPMAERVVVVADSREAAGDWLCERCPPGSGLGGVHRFTLYQLASVIATPVLAARGLAPVSPLSAEALAARVVFETRAARLRYFQPVAAMPGFAAAVARTLSELRLRGLAAADLEAAGPPGADLAHLLRAYGSALNEQGLVDRARLLELAAEVANPFAGAGLITLNVRVRFALEERFLTALAASSATCLATCIRDDEESMAAFRRALAVSPENEPERETTALDRVRACLFTSAPPPQADADATVDLFSAAGEGLECVEMARRIQSLAASGMAFDRIAVLLRDPDLYQPLLEEALRRAGVPAWFSHGTLRPDPAGRAFLSLLACAAEDLSASRFAEYLSLGQVPPAPGETGDSPEPSTTEGTLRAPWNWETLLVEASVIGSKDRWRRRLTGLDNEYQARIAQVAREDATRRESLERQRAALATLREFALPVIDALAALPRGGTWGEWLGALTALAHQALRQPGAVVAALEELQPMASVGPVALDEVILVLRERLGFLRQEPPSHRYGRVFVGTLEEARSRCFDVVFLPGMAEGMFPRRAAEDPLLLDVWRRQLPGQPEQERRRAREERLLLRLGAGAARRRLVISYPRLDGLEARSRVPSFYALEVVRAAEGRLPDLRQMERRAAAGSQARLGWPAPADAHNAIDEAEYDLAWLARQRFGRRRAGHAAYLMDANPHLARGLRARWRRWSNRWSEADGLVQPDEAARRILATQRLQERPYSPSALQQFAACPYRFFLSAIQRIGPREEAAPLEQLDPLTRGSLVHEIQFRFFNRLRKAKLLPLDADRAEQAASLLNEAIEQVAREYAEKLAPAIPRIWESEIEAIRSDLRQWLQGVVRQQSEWLPVHFELAFGLPGDASHDPASTEQAQLALGAVRLRGSVDLVERHRREPRLRVVDHKTGRFPQIVPVRVGGGKALQPLLYAAAVRLMTGTPVAQSVLRYCTARGGFQDIVIPVTEEAEADARCVAETIDFHIDRGFLPAAPQADECRYCDHRPVCGPAEERRTRRKPVEPLVRLDEIRNLP